MQHSVKFAVRRIQSTVCRTHRSKHSLLRAILYVPGDDERKVNKAQQLNVDCVALDCEDGVALNRKVAARETIRKFFDNPDRATNTHWSVRVNSVESGELDADLRCLLASGPLPDTLLLPKVESVEDLDFLNATLRKYKRQDHEFKLIFYTESCKSMLSLPKICEHAQTLSARDKLFEPIAIVCGGDDLVASLGAQKSPEAAELNYARQYCVLVAKAYGLQAIDIVFIEYKNNDGLQRQSSQGAHWGFTGKQIIHPNQIEIVQTAFLPAADRARWAQEIMTSFEEHQKTGKGAFTHQDAMIDMPTVKQAQNILEMMKKQASK